jgi:hypothetical protein
MRLRLVVACALLAVTAVAGSASARPSAVPPPPKVSAIAADFRQADFATYYRVDVTPGAGGPVTYSWRLKAPRDDLRCAKFEQSKTDADHAVWHHGDADGCDHSKMGPKGHAGRVTAVVIDRFYICLVDYYGTESGTGPAADCRSHRKVAANFDTEQAINAEHGARFASGAEMKAKLDKAAEWIDKAVDALSKFDQPEAAEAAAKLKRAKVLDKLAEEIPSKKDDQLKKAAELKRQAQALIADLP